MYEEIEREVLTQMQKFLDRGSSPVEGVRFKKLKVKYADAEKGGDRTPNLDLTGKMRDSLFIEQLGSTLRVTVGDDQMGKADGHCNFSGASRLPPRRFIPKADDGQTFKKSIINKINSIVAKHIKDDE